MSITQENRIVNRGNTLEYYSPEKVEKYLQRYIPENKDVDVKVIVDNITEFVNLEDCVTSIKIQEELYSIVQGLISSRESFWQNVAGCIKADLMRKEVFNNRGFESRLKEMFELGHKGNQYTGFFKKYSDEEISELENYIDNKNDYYLSHVGAQIAYDRYTTAITKTVHVNGKDISDVTEKIETLQERYMAISMFLLQNEKDQRMTFVKKAYDMMSQTNFTPATPTFMNAGRYNGNLSSCFIGTAGDSIEGLYREAEQFAKVSKNAGGYQHTLKR